MEIATWEEGSGILSAPERCRIASICLRKRLFSFSSSLLSMLSDNDHDVGGCDNVSQTQFLQLVGPFFFLLLILFSISSGVSYLFQSIYGFPSNSCFLPRRAAQCPLRSYHAILRLRWLAERFRFLHRICRYGDRPAYNQAPTHSLTHSRLSQQQYTARAEIPIQRKSILTPGPFEATKICKASSQPSQLPHARRRPGLSRYHHHTLLVCFISMTPHFRHRYRKLLP